MSAQEDMTSYESFEEKEMVRRMKARSDTGLADKISRKAEGSTEAVARLFKKMEEGKISTMPATDPVPSKPRLDEAAHPVRPTEPIVVTQQLNRAAPTKIVPVNKENAPKSISWTATTVEELVALYPKAHAVSDLYMVLHGATQQPGFSFALIAPHGTQYLIKANEDGKLFRADPDPNPAAFANIGLNPDFDGENIDDKSPNCIKPFGQNSHRILPNRLESKDSFDLDPAFKEKIEEGRHDIPTESLTNPGVRDVVAKLRAQAAKLRGESITQPGTALIVKPADLKVPLLEDTNIPSFTLKKLNTMLYKAQDKFNQTSNPVYESIADELSTVIAEALLGNKQSVPKNKISKVTRSAF